MLSEQTLKLQVFINYQRLLLQLSHEVHVHTLILVNHLLSIFIILLFKFDVPVKSIGNCFIPRCSLQQELSQWRLLEIFISVGLYQLEHDWIYLLSALFFKTFDRERSDLVKSLKLVTESRTFREVDIVGAEHKWKQRQRLLNVNLNPFFKHAHAFQLLFLLTPLDTLQELHKRPLVWC